MALSITSMEMDTGDKMMNISVKRHEYMNKIFRFIKKHIWVLYIFAIVLGLAVRFLTGRWLYAIAFTTFIPLVVAVLSIVFTIDRKWPIVWGMIDAVCITIFFLCMKAIIFFIRAGY